MLNLLAERLIYLLSRTCYILLARRRSIAVTELMIRIITLG